jgi:putative nucleotidyltransferase with HDIG domain
MILARVLENALDPMRRPGLEATERFMSWLRFGISALGTGAYFLSLPRYGTVDPAVQTLIGLAFLYSIPNILVSAGRPTRGTRLRILINTGVDFLLATVAIALTGGVNSEFTWLFALTIIGNVLRYGDAAGALTVAGGMLAFGAISLWQGAAPAVVVPALVSRLGFFWVLYLMAAYLSRYATRMERVARKGTQLMEAIGRIGVPVNLAGNVSLALEAVCQEITVLFDVDHVFIWLVEGQELTGAAATGEGKDDFLLLRRPMYDPSLFAARVVRERRPMFANGVSADGDAPDARLARAYGIKATAGIPLIHGNGPVGVMILADSRHPHRFREEDLAPAMLLGNLAATALYHASMHDQLRRAYHRTLETLGEAIDVRDAYTGGHSQRIARYADQIARAAGASAELLDHIRTAAMLHDIGKIGIPDSILLKPGRLTESEMDLMRSHSLIGARLLRTAGFPDEVVSIVRHLHERYDGLGYPGGLKGEAIPLGSRILAVADTYEAMTSDRIYRLALDADEATDELRRLSGIQFDPRVVEAFISVQASLRPGQADGARDGDPADPAKVFSTVASSLIDRFDHFAGAQVVDVVVSRARSNAERRGWAIRTHDGAFEVVTPDRQASLEARREVLAWLLSGIEHLGGRRTAFHLLSETVGALPPEAQEVYRALLSPDRDGAGTDLLTPSTALRAV